MGKSFLKKRFAVLKVHLPALMLGFLMVGTLVVLGACLFLLYGPASDKNSSRLPGKQPTVNIEQVDRLIQTLETRAPAIRTTSQNPFLNPEGLTIGPENP